jgi:hypothetical protein
MPVSGYSQDWEGNLIGNWLWLVWKHFFCLEEKFALENLVRNLLNFEAKIEDLGLEVDFRKINLSFDMDYPMSREQRTQEKLLVSDQYMATMVYMYWREGTAHETAVFEYFYRENPLGSNVLFSLSLV